MSVGTLFFFFLAAALIALVVRPLLSSDAAEAERLALASSEMRDLRSRLQMAQAALKDLEDDRQTDKIGDQDYRHLKGKLTAQAVDLMKRVDALESQEREAAKGPRPARFPSPRPAKRKPH